MGCEREGPRNHTPERGRGNAKSRGGRMTRLSRFGKSFGKYSGSSSFGPRATGAPELGQAGKQAPELGVGPPAASGWGTRPK